MTLGKGMLPARQLWGVSILGMICSVLPDVDVIAFHYGIPYEHVLGHRGISHSLAFAAVLALILSVLVTRLESWRGRLWQVFAFLFLATASHGVLDAMTSGGLGVAFFAPFDNSRYFFPFRPIQVSPVTVSAFFEEAAIRVLSNEMLWIWTPCFLLLALDQGIRRWRRMAAPRVR